MSAARSRRLWRLFQLRSTSLVIGCLIALSCSLTVVEIAVGARSPNQPLLTSANRVLGAVFAVELALRWFASQNRRYYFTEYWTDILSLLPAALGSPIPVALRLLRLLRLVRLGSLLRRHPILSTAVARRAPRQLLVFASLVAASLFVSTAGILAFEGGENPSVDSVREAFWFSVYSLLANEPIPGPPHTTGGRVVSLGIMVFGLATFAVFTGTISAAMVERLRADPNLLSWEELADHVIVCGWSRKADIVVRELLAAKPSARVVVIARFEGELPTLEPAIRSHVAFLNDDFTKVEVLEKAGIRRASTCILLSDTARGRSERDADARTILAALTVEKLNKNVYTCAEINRREYASHLQLGGVNSFVVSGEHSAFLLAQASLNRSVLGIFAELLTYQVGNRFHRMKAPASWKGKSFVDAMVELKEKQDAILIGVGAPDGSVKMNPSGYSFAGGEEALVISARELPPDE